MIKEIDVDELDNKIQEQLKESGTFWCPKLKMVCTPETCKSFDEGRGCIHLQKKECEIYRKQKKSEPPSNKKEK